MGEETYGIPQPVRSGRQSDAARSHGEWEDLADENPSARTPRGCEEEDEDGDEGDLRVDGGDVIRQAQLWVFRVGVGVVESDGDADDGDEELTDQHAQRAPDEQRAATESFDGPE